MKQPSIYYWTVTLTPGQAPVSIWKGSGLIIEQSVEGIWLYKKRDSTLKDYYRLHMTGASTALIYNNGISGGFPMTEIQNKTPVCWPVGEGVVVLSALAVGPETLRFLAVEEP